MSLGLACLLSTQEVTNRSTVTPVSAPSTETSTNGVDSGVAAAAAESSGLNIGELSAVCSLAYLSFATFLGEALPSGTEVMGSNVPRGTSLLAEGSYGRDNITKYGP